MSARHTVSSGFKDSADIHITPDYANISDDN